MRKKFGLIAIILSIAMFSSCGDAASQVESQASLQISFETQDALTVSSDSDVTNESEQTEASLEAGEDHMKITLSGKREDSILTSDYCYVMGERCVLFLDKEVLLPGDFDVNVDLIISTLEEITGLEFQASQSAPMVPSQTDYLGFDPWRDIEYGQRVPVYVYTDMKDEHYVSCANAKGVILFFNELISQEVWDSVPTYKENSWRRMDFIPYEVVAHEMTHFLTMRHAMMNDIMMEGSADYYAGKVLDALEHVSRDFSESKAHFYVSYAVKNDVTSQNAEEIFRNDYSDVDFADRGDEYTYGRMLCAFLEENYGDGFLQDYLSAMREKGYGYPEYTYRIPEEEDAENFMSAFKETFGDEIFSGFGEYYQTHKEK